MTGLWGDDEPVKRTLGIRDKQILYDEIAKGKCQNCGSEIKFSDVQVGHKTAYSKGGSTRQKNSVALCYRCNKLQGTDSWEAFQRKQGKTIATDKLAGILNKLEHARTEIPRHKTRHQTQEQAC